MTEAKPGTRSKAVKEEKSPRDKSRYVEAIGRRKAATARVRIYPSTNKPLKEISEKESKRTTPPIDVKKLDFVVNQKPLESYFGLERLKQIAIAPFNALNVTFRSTVKVQGGGPTGQAESIRLGLSRALTSLNEKWRARLKKSGFLMRDPRVVERKHPGLRKARRPQQWRKR